MILFTILALTIILLVIFIVAAVSVGGAISIILFGDVIVCIVIIAWIIYRLFGRK